MELSSSKNNRTSATIVDRHCSQVLIILILPVTAFFAHSERKKVVHTYLGFSCCDSGIPEVSGQEVSKCPLTWLGSFPGISYETGRAHTGHHPPNPVNRPVCAGSFALFTTQAISCCPACKQNLWRYSSLRMSAMS